VASNPVIADLSLGAQTKMPMPAARTIDVDGIGTRYYEAGCGETIVFIYGGSFGTSDSASSAHTWNLNLLPLASRFRVIAFDKIGQGFTDNPGDDDYTMAAVVRHAGAFLRALQLPPVHLVGHSRGGYAAARLTLAHHDLVRSLTLVNSGTLSPGVGTNEVVLARPPFPKGSAECVRWVYRNYSFNPAAVTDAWVAAVLEVLALPKYRESIERVEGARLGATLFLPALAREKRETLQWINEGRLQRPVQIIWGSEDRTAILQRGLDLFHLLARHDRRVQFHAFGQAGHFPFREHPARFNALLGRFVAAHAA